MKQKQFYVPPQMKGFHVILERGIATACSLINPNGIMLEDWEVAKPEDNSGDVWLPI